MTTDEITQVPGATAADDLSLAEFLPIDAVEDDLDAEPEDVETHAADAELHAVPPADIDMAFLAFGAVGPPMTTDASSERDRTTRDHELDLEEILDATTHSHDPARDHDWAGREPRRAPSADAIELPDAHHRDEFVCTVCFLARPAHQRVEPGVDRCVDCA
jgi:hypothetical protein